MKKKKIGKWISFFLLLLLILVFLFPYYVMITGAFKSQMALQLIPPDLNPFRNLTGKNAAYVWQKTEILLWLANSAAVSLGTAVITMFIGATAGYAFAKKRFRGRGVIFALVIATMLLPRQMLLIPNYLVAMKLHLTNSRIGLVLTTVSPAFGVFLCRQFMGSIPTELLEAAEIDGANIFQRFIKIDLPMLASQMKLTVTLAIINAVQVFDTVYILTKGGPGTATITPSVVLYEQGFTYRKMGYASAIGVIMFAIIMILTVINQRVMKNTERMD